MNTHVQRLEIESLDRVIPILAKEWRASGRFSIRIDVTHTAGVQNLPGTWSRDNEHLRDHLLALHNQWVKAGCPPYLEQEVTA